MKRKSMIIASVLFAAFVIWTILVQCVNLQPIGPDGTSVGFSGLNGYWKQLVGVNMSLYILTDWLSIIPLAVIMCFGILGCIQWIRRKRLLLVDRDILALGVFYIAALSCFLLFEYFVVNYRPILIDGKLEASYPSSTTMLVLCVMLTARMQVKRRIKRDICRRWLNTGITCFVAFMLVGRILSGVHWLTDIIGAVVLSACLLLIYHTFTFMNEE